MKLTITLAVGLLITAPVLAEEEKAATIAAPASDEAPLGTTAEWLQLQRSGAARGAPNPLPGEALELVYERFLGSFDPNGAKQGR